MNTNLITTDYDPVPGKASRPEVEVTWGRAAKIWWSLMWRSVFFGVIAGGLVGGVIGFIMGAAGASPRSIVTLTYWSGVITAIPVGVWVVRYVLKKSWSDFRINLVAKNRF